jgi:hypothetical protein
MALVYSSNQQPTTSADAFYRLITLLVSAGWTVAAAGDGLSAYSPSSGTAVTSSGSGANGFNNTNAWIFIKMPGSNRGFVFIVTSSTNVTIRYFGPSTAVTNTPSATTAPASTTTNAGAQDLVSNVAYVGTLNRVNYWADNTAPYGFGMHGWSAAGSPTFHFILEPLQAGTYHTLNQDPYLIITLPNTSNSNFIWGGAASNGSWAPLNSKNNSNVKCWTKYNMSGATFNTTNVVQCVVAAASILSANSVIATMTLNQGVSTYDNRDEEYPITYVVCSSSDAVSTNFGSNQGIPVGPGNTMVGMGTYIKNHLQYRANLDVLSTNSTYDRVHFGTSCTVPNGGVIPSIP